MRFGTVCTGIGAPEVALIPLGWTAAWFAEIEAFPSSVLAHRWPTVPNLGDMTKLPARVRAGEIEAPGALIGGTPCQAFSVAGARAGLIDPRGQLTLTYVDLLNAIDEQRPDDECIGWWENVPGVLSDKDNAFGCFLGLLAGEECELVPPGKSWPHAGVVHGPQRSIAWRVLDAQYFGLAQRRKRVFVIASARKGFDPAEILFEPAGVRRDIAPSREAGQGVTYDLAPCLTSSGRGVERTGDPRGNDPVVAVGIDLRNGAITGQVAHTIQAGAHAPDPGSTPHRMCGVPLAFGGNNTSGPIDLATALNAYSSPSDRLDFDSETFIVQPVEQTALNSAVDYKNGAFEEVDCARTLTTSADRTRAAPVVAYRQVEPRIVWRVRRLIPRECERLQGFPEDHTLVPHRGKPAADGPRYKAIGNSMAVPVIRWIGRRLNAWLAKQLRAAA